MILCARSTSRLHEQNTKSNQARKALVYFSKSQREVWEETRTTFFTHTCEEFNFWTFSLCCDLTSPFPVFVPIPFRPLWNSGSSGRKRLARSHSFPRMWYVKLLCYVLYGCGPLLFLCGVYCYDCSCSFSFAAQSDGVCAGWKRPVDAYEQTAWRKLGMSVGHINSLSWRSVPISKVSFEP